VGRSSAFSYSASRYSYSYSKTPGSIQVDHLFSEAVTPLFGPFVNEIPILLFEYEYRFTEYEYEYDYEKNHWYELLATIMPDGPNSFDGNASAAQAASINAAGAMPHRRNDAGPSPG
jgi:hypothetical protein